MSPNFDIRKARDLIESAYKLRQKLLFRDCIIYIAGNVHQTTVFLHEIENSIFKQALQQVLLTVRNKFFESLVGAQEAMHLTASDDNVPLFKITKDVSMKVSEHGNFSQPEFYRKLVNREEKFAESLEEALSRNLQLDSSAMARVGDYEDHFFCGSLSDEELLWDTTETDW